MFKFVFHFTSEPQMQEVGCVASPGDLLLRPTVFVTRPGIHGWRSWWRSRAEGPAWLRSWWRPCLVKDVCRGVVGSWLWSDHHTHCYHKLPAFVPYRPDDYICFTTCWSKTSAVCSRPGLVRGELMVELRRWRTTRNRPTRIPRKFVFSYMVDLKGKIQLLWDRKSVV